MAEKYKFLEHTADIKFRVYGRTLGKIFENTTLAFCEIISRKKKIRADKKKKIKLRAEDLEGLLYSFIDELIYLLDAKNFLVCKAKVKVKESKGESRLEGEVFGDNAGRYDDLDHIKAATYHEMYVRQKKDKAWEAQVVVDV